MSVSASKYFYLSNLILKRKIFFHGIILFGLSIALNGYAEGTWRLPTEISLNPVCSSPVAVPLNSEGMAVIAASRFDAGSSSGYGAVYFKARRMDVPQDFNCFLDGNPLYQFDDHVKFCCEDVPNDSLMVIMRVYDQEPVPGPVPDDYLEGHFADCMLRVIVQDKRAPAIVCPSDLTISCEFLFAPDNLSVFGDVATDPADRDSICIDDIGNPDTDGLTCIGLDGLATDNCLVTMTVDSIITIDSLCGTGMIRRIFTATDPGGLTATCEQVVTIVNFTPFVEDSIDWPDDYTTFDICQIDSLDPEDLQYPYNEPVYGDNVCSMITEAHHDLVFDFSDPLQACFKILRTWTVIDWCQYEPGGSAGIWTKTQIIKVLNTMPPAITLVEQDSIQCTDDAACGPGNFVLEASADDDCSAPEALNWTVAVDEQNDGSLDQIFSPLDGPDVQIPVVLPLGAHRILFSVEDYCGNQTTEEQYLTVVSCKPPSPKCKNLVSTFMRMDDDNDGVSDWGMSVIWASDFDAGSEHPCDYPVSFSFNEEGTMDSLVFDCEDIGVNDSIPMWVIDDYGNADYCLVTLTIQDNLDACPDDFQPHSIVSGTITTASDEFVPDVIVDLKGSNLTQPTLSNGTYVFPPMPNGGNYEVSPGLNINHRKGISTIDLIILQKHLLGLQPLQDPYIIIAADVNHSGTLSAIDVVNLRKLVLGVTDTIPNNTSWRFVDAAYAFSDTMHPLAEAFPESYVIGTLEKDMQNIDFIAVKVGDLNGSAMQGIGGTDVDTRSAPVELKLAVQDQILQAGESATLQMYCERAADLATMQFTLSWDPGKVEIKPIPGPGFLSDINWSTELLDAGKLPVSWTQYDALPGSTSRNVMTLRVTAKGSGNLTDADLTMDSAITEAEVLLSGGVIAKPTLEIWPATSTSEHMVVYQNRPNPFDHKTLIPVILPETSEFRIEVFREDGTRVFEQDLSGRKGYNQIMLDMHVLGGPGIYMYRVSTANEYRTLRMIVVGE